MSPKSAGQAVKAGYTNVRVMIDGEPSWRKAGHPLHAAYGHVCKGNIVLVDLRSAEKDAERRIPRSVSMPFVEFEDNYESIPLKAPVVLYSDNEEETLTAMRILAENGYKKVSMVQGNFQGWTKLGGMLERGKVDTDITWKRILAKGEVSLEDFNKAIKDTQEAFILDVRTDDETSTGKLAGATAIPLDEVCSRLGEIPKDKKVYIHCTTGARAEMAAKELKKYNYDSFYLVAEVECEGSQCDIVD
ncbi:MAG: rhodanese-like domain-containing protein [Spirochaetales bacterium]|jgi:rhodanese-related sulfurtransferase|nr:rhodanese-like domain-containing protein [Spirochaetales bacterium]